MAIKFNIRKSEHLFKTTFDNGYSVKVTFDESAEYMYELEINVGGYYRYEGSNNPNEIFKYMDEIKNYE